MKKYCTTEMCGFFLACEDFGSNVRQFIPRLRFFFFFESGDSSGSDINNVTYFHTLLIIQMRWNSSKDWCRFLFKILIAYRFGSYCRFFLVTPVGSRARQIRSEIQLGRKRFLTLSNKGQPLFPKNTSGRASSPPPLKTCHSKNTLHHKIRLDDDDDKW